MCLSYYAHKKRMEEHEERKASPHRFKVLVMDGREIRGIFTDDQYGITKENGRPFCLALK